MTFAKPFLSIALLAGAAVWAQEPAEVPINAPFVTTPAEVVTAMLKLAGAGRNDVVYDLGCGDGRIVVSAARDFGARAVGIEISPEHLEEARRNAARAGVSSRVEFRQQDIFDTDLSRATVVTLYLLPGLNLRLRPKLLRELRPGTRVVSHTFDMGDWKPDRTLAIYGTRIHYWVIPGPAKS